MQIYKRWKEDTAKSVLLYFQFWIYLVISIRDATDFQSQENKKIPSDFSPSEHEFLQNDN